MLESAHKLFYDMYKFLTSQHERKVMTGENELTTWSRLFFSFRHFPYKL